MVNSSSDRVQAATHHALNKKFVWDLSEWHRHKPPGVYSWADVGLEEMNNVIQNQKDGFRDGLPHHMFHTGKIDGSSMIVCMVDTDRLWR